MHITVPNHCFYFNATATTEIYTLSLHDALPISLVAGFDRRAAGRDRSDSREPAADRAGHGAARGHRHRDWHRRSAEDRSEEHTSELQSRFDLVCRLLLEKKKVSDDKNRSCVYHM